MVYKAKVDIGKFKVGEVVPDVQAKIWINQFKESPVELVEEKKEVISNVSGFKQEKKKNKY